MPAATASPCSHCPYPIAFSIAWPNVWPKLSSARSPCSRSSAPTISALIRQLSWIACASAAGSRATSASICASSHARNARVADRAVLDHFREARGELARRQRAQAIGVDQHGARLVERADHVLAERVVDAGLAAHRRVDLREQRRRHLHERHAALVDRRRESRDVADDAAAQRDQRGRALGAQFEQPRHHRLQRLPVLVGFAVRDLHRLRRDARGRQAFGQRREPVAGDRRVGHDDRLRDAALREQRTGAADDARADVDRIAALRERDLERPHVSPEGPPRGTDLPPPGAASNASVGVGSPKGRPEADCSGQRARERGGLRPGPPQVRAPGAASTASVGVVSVPPGRPKVLTAPPPGAASTASVGVVSF